ncbi:AAA family ATPase [archaeon]|jgi:hypothetical protein|nr:AAA family ATPase [archaeon]MBT4396648.1 AAA family ATPase [archaeon]MBT4441258.1 AAA family ATPase [archaeon]
MKISNQLQRDDLRFILLKYKNKSALEEGWNKDVNYSFSNPKLTKHIEEGKNYGLICGNGLIVIDADTKRLNEIVKEKLPETFSVKTAKGYHYYYWCLDFLKKKVLNDGSEHLGEIQSNGSYVVAPNSIHPSGRIYEVSKDVEIAELDKEYIDNLFNKYYSSERLGKEVILDGVESGMRNDSMFKLACSFRTKDLTPEETYQTLDSINQKNSPPLSEYELKKVIESAYNYKNEDYSKLQTEFSDLEVSSLRDMMIKGVPEIEWRIKNLVPQSGITIIGGTAGAYKSWAVMNMAICCSRGYDFLDKYKVEPCKVLYVDEENGNVTVPVRMKMLLHGFGLDGTEIELNDIVFSIFNNVTLDTPGGSKKLRYLIEKHKPRLIVIDSMVRCMQGVEDKSSDVRAVFDNLKNIFKDYSDLAFVILHHTVKTTGRHLSMTKLRGSGDFAAFSDVVLMFSAYHKYVNRVYVGIEKNRHVNMQDVPNFAFDVVNTDRDGLKLVYSKETAEQDAIEDCKLDILNWIEEEDIKEFATKFTLNSMYKLGHKKNTIYSTLKRMVQDGDISKLKRGLYQSKEVNLSTEDKS